jgi:hypothetical protein
MDKVFQSIKEDWLPNVKTVCQTVEETPPPLEGDVKVEMERLLREEEDAGVLCPT